GFSAFVGQSVRWYQTGAGALIWLGLYAAFDWVRDDIDVRIMIFSAICATYGLLVARIGYRNWSVERLPSMLGTAVIYGSHGLFYLFRLPLTLIWPVYGIEGPYQSLWYSVLTLEAFVHGVMASFIFVVAIRERTERLYRLAAEIDGLTGAASRRFFVSRTREFLGRRPEAGVLAVLDLDYFKKVNDTYGHMAGDKVLAAFGAHVSSRLPADALFGRLGGEEFGLFFPNCSAEQAYAELDAIRAEIEALDIVFMGAILRISTSIGMTTIEDAGLDFDNLMAAADNALYIAKGEGRNRVCQFHPAQRLQKIVEAGEDSRVSLSKRRVSRLSVRSHSNKR
ncbi:MAG: hypothetical protein RLZZ444_1387, partial [Pseudomonadota bacterium]